MDGDLPSQRIRARGVRGSALAKSQDRPAVRDIPKQVTALLDNAAGLADEAEDELVECLLRLRFIALSPA